MSADWRAATESGSSAQLSSPAKAGDPVFQRRQRLNRKSRGVLDPPPSRGMTGRFGSAKSSCLQLRLVALVDHVLAFALAESGLVVDHFADARHHRALDPRISRP